MVRLAQTLLLTVADLLVWATLLWVGYAGFYALAEGRQPIAGGELLLFQVFFYSLYILAPAIAMIATYAAGYYFHMGGARQATIIALGIIALISLPLLALFSVTNSCNLAMSFPFEAHCGD